MTQLPEPKLENLTKAQLLKLIYEHYFKLPTEHQIAWIIYDDATTKNLKATQHNLDQSNQALKNKDHQTWLKLFREYEKLRTESERIRNYYHKHLEPTGPTCNDNPSHPKLCPNQA